MSLLQVWQGGPHSEGETAKVELNSTTISARQTEELKILIKEKISTFKQGHRVLESLSFKRLVAEGDFKAKFILIIKSSK